MVCLDTHALLWWALDREKLSEKARRMCVRMERDGGYASAISLWEIGLKIKNQKLDIGLSVEEFARRIARTGVVEFVPVDTELWMANLRLTWEHRDPADRTIVATARHLKVPLLTKDEIIQAFAPARAIW
jgi:PIN domain nuclease of toxin-antitoxin system